MHSVKRSTTTRSNNDADGEGVWLPLVAHLDLLLGLGDHSSRIPAYRPQACSQGQHDIESDNSVASCSAFAEAEFEMLE